MNAPSPQNEAVLQRLEAEFASTVASIANGEPLPLTCRFPPNDPVPGLWAVDADLYHADTVYDSHSSLEMFRESVTYYAAVRVHRTMRPRPATAAMKLGIRVHCRILEPAEFARRYVVSPGFSGKGSVQAKRDFASQNAGREILTAEEFWQIEGMTASVWKNKQVRKALESPGRAELSIRRIDQETGCGLKSRLDWLLDSGVIVDFKTSKNPYPHSWKWSAVDYGYDRQAALYLDGAQQVLGADGPFLHVAIGTEPPYDVVPYLIGQTDIEIGRAANRETLIELAGRRAEDDWESPYEEVQEITLPRRRQ